MFFEVKKIAGLAIRHSANPISPELGRAGRVERLKMQCNETEQYELFPASAKVFFAAITAILQLTLDEDEKYLTLTDSIALTIARTLESEGSMADRHRALREAMNLAGLWVYLGRAMVRANNGFDGSVREDVCRVSAGIHLEWIGQGIINVLSDVDEVVPSGINTSGQKIVQALACVQRFERRLKAHPSIRMYLE